MFQTEYAEIDSGHVLDAILYAMYIIILRWFVLFSKFEALN